ncbi:hypothetical protein BCAR13_10002 [Paraburkholderia caribensis]|nr:hypothetical protein BCAR13_10002 [Paraburkholderia caribensis]
MRLTSRIWVLRILIARLCRMRSFFASGRRRGMLGALGSVVEVVGVFLSATLGGGLGFCAGIRVSLACFWRRRLVLPAFALASA